MAIVGQRLGASFFRKTPTECARQLIGCTLHWEGCAGEVVETEAYAAEGDPACHTFVRPSARRFVSEHDAGTAYVYINYGVHWLFNVLVKGAGGNGFVLFRALEPRHGVAQMRRRRSREHPRELCSGPGKLTQALGIGPTAHGASFLAAARTAITAGGHGPTIQVATSTRIGISAGKDLKWRFLKHGSPCLSAPKGR